MDKAYISLFVLVGLYFSVFANDLSESAERLAFEKLTLRINAEKLSGKDCEEFRLLIKLSRKRGGFFMMGSCSNA